MYKFLLKPLNHFNQFLACIIGFGVLHFSFQYAILRQWDFYVYYLAAKAIHLGANPYNPKVLEEIGSNIIGVGYAGLPYLYSPFLAWLISPIAYLAPFVAAFMWLSLKCIALEIIILISLKLLHLPNSILWLVITHTACVYFRPIGLDMNSGNVAIFESMFVLIFFLMMRKDKNYFASISLWLASFFKGYPLLLLLYPLHLRRWKLIKAFSIITGLLLFLSLFIWINIYNWLMYFRSDAWKMMWDEQVQSYYNCSSTTVILRTFSDTYFAEPLIHLDWAVLILVPLFPVLIFLTSALSIQKFQAKETTNHFSALIISFLICTLLLLPPRLAGYTLAWLYFPLITSLVYAIQSKNYLSITLSLIATVLLQIYIAPEHVPHGIVQLLIDKEFFGLLFIYLSLLWIILKQCYFSYKK